MDAFVDACVPEEDCAAERAWGRQIVKRSNSRAAVELMECMEGIDIDSRLSRIRHRCLVLHGTRDVITTMASSERLASALPNAKLVIADGAGHVPTVTRPQWVAEQIDRFFE
jgi:pimeloyl-ACP methyl ester carboxylesterase